jgi:peptidoglycan-binding protein ArfA
MAESGEAARKETPTVDEWRRVSKYYRRPLGLAWLVGLVVIPLLLGAIGYGLQDRPMSWATGPTGKVPTLTRPAPAPGQLTGPRVPAIILAPASIVRDGNNITLSGAFPDQKARAALVDAVTTALPPGVSLIDRLGINPDVNALDFTDAGRLFSAAAGIPDFKLTVQGDTVTLAGTASTADQHDAVKQAAEDTWPNVNILDTLKISGPVAPTQSPPPTAAPSPPPPGPSPQGDCRNLQQAIRGALPEPITFGVDAATLTADIEHGLTVLAARLKACPGARIVVNGYSDNTGNDGINIPLSAERATAVADFLVAQGVPHEQLTSKGLGSASPVAGNGTPEGRAQNRRVEIVAG